MHLHHVPKSMSCQNAIVVITGREHYFHDYIDYTYIYILRPYIYIRLLTFVKIMQSFILEKGLNTECGLIKCLVHLFFTKCAFLGQYHILDSFSWRVYCYFHYNCNFGVMLGQSTYSNQKSIRFSECLICLVFRYVY